ncbi:MAG TPA: carbonic anhydrase, partial [Gemmataceae bacterium]|nr:carbonic anhydrase [Gemmataceae bacterium]
MSVFALPWLELSIAVPLFGAACVGDILSVQVAGAVADEQVLGGVEFACAAGAKVVLVLGHVRCPVAESAASAGNPAATGCRHMEDVVRGIRESMTGAGERNEAFVNDV